MKLTLEINLEEALKILNDLDIDEVAIKTTDVVTVNTHVPKTRKTTNKATDDMLYQPAKGKRRDHLDMAKGERELELGRRMTPEEEGEVEARFEDKHQKTKAAKEKIKQQIHVEEVAKEVQEAINTESNDTLVEIETPTEGASIPATENLVEIDSMFKA